MAEPLQSPSTKPQKSGKYTILYVDDEARNLTAFKASFRRHYQVLTALSGEEAIELMHQHPVDLVITDQRMPRMTGVQLLEKIIELFPDPVRMVLTGYADIEAIIHAINKGQIYYYVTKPWRVDELMVVFDKAFEAYELRRQNVSLEKEKQDLLLRAERQEKENILSRYETLKNQVNPHFLFNCLNALTSLVHDEPDRAVDFIAKLTKVYRYVLDSGPANLVSLEDELQFLKSYFFLQKTRFATNLQLDLQIDDAVLDRYLPPLTLQMLVENAIKHNIVSQETPLQIAVYNEGADLLVVRNNLQPRTDDVPSTGLGQKNLLGRYRYLEGGEPSFGPEGPFYLARIPLIESDD